MSTSTLKRRRGEKHQFVSSVFPQHPKETRVLLRVGDTDLSCTDRLLVAGSSLLIVGSFVWVPAFAAWMWKKWRAIPKENKRRRAFVAVLFVASVALATAGPHRSPRTGKWLNVRKWRLWDAWLKFVAMEVISDQPIPSKVNTLTDQAILAFVPHGIFPFAFAFGVFPELAQRAFGFFYPVVATATTLFPFVRDFLSWAEAIDASRASVDRALSEGKRIGIVPGGIAEIFEGYPKPNTSPDEEYAVVRRGFLRMAIKYGVPVIPVYCFGATKMFHRLQLPPFLEKVSLMLRVSICVFGGAWGLPIPFRQRLSYVVGQPILPPATGGSVDQQVDQMQESFCKELMRLFDRHKEAYGWSHKSLKLLSR